MEKSDEGRLFRPASALALLGGALTLPAAAATTPAGACRATPEGEIGPFFADDGVAAFNRGTILTNLDGSSSQPGIPLTLTIRVHDTRSSCGPMAAVQIDIWHCNAAGVYSDEPSEGTSSQTWLRGYQRTDRNGTVTFRTIVPGWYPGRTTHIHLRARSKYNDASSPRDGTNTTQLFFPQALVEAISTGVAPYSARGSNPTTNARDGIYAAQTRGANELVLTGSTATGYRASFALGLPIG
jgi:protocatechuate 3,4-dioxygenase beta subunit